MEYPYNNNHFCTKSDCNYRTMSIREIRTEADDQLKRDGGYNTKDKTKCPICKDDSLVFLPK